MPSFVVMAAASPAQAKQKEPQTQYIPDSASVPVDEANRRVLEQHAGTEGGKMLLRSVPTGARVFVDGAFVGRTPLLLIVAAGKYSIEMMGDREAFGERTVEMAAKETQEVAITLASRYPQHVTAH